MGWQSSSLVAAFPRRPSGPGWVSLSPGDRTLQGHPSPSVTIIFLLKITKILMSIKILSK